MKRVLIFAPTAPASGITQYILNMLGAFDTDAVRFDILSFRNHRLKAWCEAHGKTIEEVLHAGWDIGVAWQDGRGFHGPCHIRMNLALPLSRVQEAFDRLDKHLFNA